MSFDLNGLKPRSAAGKRFSVSNWEWRPLWEFLRIVGEGTITPEDYRLGENNNFHRIGADKTAALVKRLDIVIQLGAAKMYLERRARALKSLPREVCRSCQGKGRRAYVAYGHAIDGCGTCRGTGLVAPTPTQYHLDMNGIRSFLEFARASGGFEIG